MQNHITASLSRVVASLQDQGVLTGPDLPPVEVQRAPPHIGGDYSTNLALKCGKHSKLSPADLAMLVIKELESESWCERAEFVKPGFINLYCGNAGDIIRQIIEEDAKFGAGAAANKQKILIEYVSANPTGPLHTGHGRAAALGSALANILRFVGHQVDTEYYVNDAGRQMDILTSSTLWRMLELKEILEKGFIPDNMYQGDYVNEMAERLLETLWQDLSGDIEAVAQDAITERKNADAEERLDDIIAAFKQGLAARFAAVRERVLAEMMEGLKRDLADFGVEFTNWYYESSSAADGKDLKMLELLKDNNYAYEKDGALWFRGARLGDDKDRVLQRRNENLTYFGSDIYYHHNKYQRGYEVIMDILGADHHGYIQRIRSSMTALGHDEARLKFLLLQLVFLVSDGKRDSMSTRAGKFTSLKDLVVYLGEGAEHSENSAQTVGRDAARFFFLMHKSERAMNFDLQLARKQSRDNPVYYVQYAYARVCSIFEELAKRGDNWEELYQRLEESPQGLSGLDDPHEKDLAAALNQFIPTLQSISGNYEVHLLANYLRSLAGSFHSYYNAVRILSDTDKERMAARLALCQASGIIIKSGLTLMGVSAPRRM